MILNPYAIVIDVYATLGGKQPGATSYADHKAYINANGQAAYLTALEGMFATQTNATMSATILGNLGLASVFTAAQGEAYLAANAGNRVKAALDLASALTNYVSDATNTNDAAILAAKTTYVATTANAYTYASNSANTADAATSSAAVSTGQTFTLTTGADTVTGTTGADTFSGVRAATAVAATDTLDAVDTIDGGEGADVMFITSTAANTDATGGARISNIETVNLRQTAAADIALNAANTSGVEVVNSYLSTGTVTVTNLGAGDSIGLVGNAALTLGELTASYAATATAANIGIAGGTGATTADNINIDNGAGLLSAAITSSGANTLAAVNFGVDAAGVAGTATGIRTVTINASDTLTITGGITGIANNSTSNTITISGDATRVNIGTLDADVDLVNASGLTAGGVITTLAAAAQSVTGGAGNDRINLAALAVAGSINAGEGTDTVVFTNSTNFASVVSKLSGFEVLRGDTAGSYNLGALTGITALEIDTGSITFTNLSADQANAVTVLGNTTLASINLATASGTADSATVTLDNDAATATAVTVTDITAPNIETLNVVSGDALTTGTANVVSDFDGSTSVKTLNVSGTSDLTLSDITDLASNATVDATGFAHRLIVSAGVTAGDTVKGGSGNDSVTVAFGQLGTTTSFVGGAGDDTLTVSGNTFDIVDADFAMMSGIENLVITGTDGTATLQGFAQAAIQSIDGNSDGRLDITATNLTDAATIDASALINAGVDIAFTTVSAAVDANVVYGGALNDTITYTQTGAFATTGDIRGGNGIDTITLASDALGIETVLSTATSLANSDIVTGLTTTVDKYDYNGTLTNAAATTGSGATLAAAIAAQAAAGTYVVSTDIADSGSNSSGSTMAAVLASTASNLATNYAAFEAQLVGTGGILASTITGLDAEAAAGESFLLSVDNGTGAVVMRVVNTTATGNTITADEIDLVGVFTNTVMVAADFA